MIWTGLTCGLDGFGLAVLGGFRWRAWEIVPNGACGRV